jgi:hypothetical protein
LKVRHLEEVNPFARVWRPLKYLRLTFVSDSDGRLMENQGESQLEADHQNSQRDAAKGSSSLFIFLRSFRSSATIRLAFSVSSIFLSRALQVTL